MQGTPGVPLLDEGLGWMLLHDARDLKSMSADWDEGMRCAGTGTAPANQPLVPTRLRFTLSYLSMLGGRVTQIYVWETDRIELPDDPYAWRLETLTLDPGPDNGAPITVRRPD